MAGQQMGNSLSKFRNRARVRDCVRVGARAESLKLSGDRDACSRCLTLYPCRKPLLYVSERVSERVGGGTVAQPSHQPSHPTLSRHLTGMHPRDYYTSSYLAIYDELGNRLHTLFTPREICEGVSPRIIHSNCQLRESCVHRCST